MLYNNFEKNMRSNKISFAHKNRLILFTKITHEHDEKPVNLELCPTAVTFSKELQMHSLNSKEKQNRKIVLHQNYKNADEKHRSSLKLRSFSTNIEPKALSNLSNSQLQKKQLRFIQSNKNSSLQSKIVQLVDQLKKKYIIFQSHLTSYTIKKDHFHNLLYCLAKPCTVKSSDCSEDDFSSFSKNFEQISLWMCDSVREATKQRLKIQGQNMQHTITRSQYLQQVVNSMSEIQKINHDKIALLEELKNIQKFKTDITKQVYQKQEQINGELRIIQKNTLEINSTQSQLQTLKKQLSKYKEEVAKVKEASASISNYVGNQANKLIAMASQQYKNIESEIYEYASYLQCNQLASSLAYEPLSITCLTDSLEEQLKNINRTLVQNEDMPAKEKGKLMRDFLLQWMNRYKKKDDEQKELMAFKTKCVQNFIQKMKKWLDNWTLKQEYLVGLRDQFALDTVSLNSCLAQLASQPLCQNCSNIKPIMANLTETYLKIENNYKMGNSFY